MKKTIARWAVLACGLAASMALAAPAAATGNHHHNPPKAEAASEHLKVKVKVTGACTAEVTVKNRVPEQYTGSWAYWADYRLDGQTGAPDSTFPPLPRLDDGSLDIGSYGDAHDHGVTPEQEITSGPLAGQTFGPQYHPFVVHQGDTRVVEVTVTEPTTISAGVRRGPEQPWYVDWTKPIEIPCPTDPADLDCEWYEAVAVLVEEHGLETAVAMLNEAHDFAPELTSDHVTALLDECQPADDGGDKGDDGDDGGTGGGDDTLPMTGSTAALLGGGAGLLLMAGGGAYLVARRKRVSFTA